MAQSLFGDPPANWVVSTLGEACAQSGGDIQTGPFGSQLHASDYVAWGIPSIMPQNLGDDTISTEGIAYIRQEDAERLSRYLVRPGDIVYSRRGDVTKRALVGKEHDGWLCGTGCLRVRFGNNQVNPRYVFYYLGHPLVRDWISRHAIGATLPNLNTSILSALPFVVPPSVEQRAIAHILGTLDDKIELNRQVNETLEALARALFKSWFVDFDPVKRNQARKRGETVQSAEALAKVDALFPDSFQDSPLGKIPRGWSVHRLDDIAHFLNGLALQKYPPDGKESLPVIKIAQLRKGNTEGADQAAADIPSEYVVEDGDVLFSWSGSLEVVIWCGGRGVTCPPFLVQS